MRPKSALYYTEDLERIALDVTEVIEAEVDQAGTLDVVKICQKYSLEAVAYIFLGWRLVIEITDTSGEITQKLMLFPLSWLPYIPEYKRWTR